MINTVIETFDGTTANRINCRYIKGEYYIKNKQCFLINGTWYRVNSGLIAFDNETQGWVVIKDTPSLLKGIIDYDSTTSEAILGYFSPNPFKNVNVIVANGNSYTAANRTILPPVFKEHTGSMTFVHQSRLGSLNSSAIPSVNYGNNGYPYALPYCCKHYDQELYKRFLTGATGLRVNTTRISQYIRAIGDHSFGFEFETTKGKIPNYKVMETGLLPLRDGSIQGIEFATIPLKGETGAAILENACANLKQYTTFSENESLHLHIGNIPTTKKFVGSLYTVCCILEKDIYSMFPKYYAQTSKFKARAKDYNMPLKKEFVSMTPEETFDNISFYLSEGKKYQGFGSEHPNDPEGHAKWSVSTRYHWINFIPLLFGNNKTIEFRCHVPTRDPIKVFNWLYICSAIVKYAELVVRNNVDLNTKRDLTLQQVINSVYDRKLANYLSAYVSERQSNRVSDDLTGDFIGMNEISAELKGKVLYKDIN